MNRKEHKQHFCCELDAHLSVECHMDEEGDIWVGHSEISNNILMTPEVARKMAKRLIELADKADSFNVGMP